jgi:Type I phosphodiesterase / nucleotide pyrophosphatase
MVHSPQRSRALWAFLALAGATACSSRFKLEQAQESKDSDECTTIVAAGTGTPQTVTAEPAPTSASIESVESATTPPPIQHADHDCAHEVAGDTSNGVASLGPIDGPSNGYTDPNSSQPAAVSAQGDGGTPFVKPPRVPTPSAPSRADVSYAVMISVDGLAARFLEQVIDAGNAPTFKALQSLAAWTHNARTDKTYTITLPNHTSMLTGLPVSPSPGFDSFRAHRYTNNTDPLTSETLHTLRLPERDYTPSVFDVVHDRGRSTALFASKTKFSLYTQTYNDAGGPDSIGEDNGRQKIDTVVINTDPPAMVDQLILALTTNPANYTFVHLNQPDTTGHSIGWGTPEYLAAVANMDVLLGRILSTIQTGPLAGKTALIVTTDHGGVGWGHSDSADALNFQIPFYVMAPGVPSGDAYAAFGNRFSPDLENPEYKAVYQPLRNGDSGNLALYLLGLPPIPESVIHSAGIRISR